MRETEGREWERERERERARESELKPPRLVESKLGKAWRILNGHLGSETCCLCGFSAGPFGGF